jgi:hypothetical protein
METVLDVSVGEISIINRYKYYLAAGIAGEFKLNQHDALITNKAQLPKKLKLVLFQTNDKKVWLG